MSERPLARYGKVLGISALCGLVAGGVTGVVSVFSEDGGLVSALIVGGAITVAMALGVGASLRWWRGLDEAAQEAHKWAWWWGSTGGLIVAVVALFTLVYGAPALFIGVDPRDMLLAGAALIALTQTAGYAVAWSAWWLKRR